MAEIWNGQLMANVMYNTTYNAYELVETIADQLLGLSNSPADMFKRDAGLYNTDHVFTDFDLIPSYVFDPDDTNVLKPGYKVTPKQEFIRMGESRQISLYTPTEFLTKTAWMSEGSWSQFNSVVQKSLENSKKAYETLMGNVAIGTMESTVGNQQVTIEVPKINSSDTYVEREAKARVKGQTIAKTLEVVKADVNDLVRGYNDYGFAKSFRFEDLVPVYNIEAIADITKMDLPGLYHDNIMDLTGRTMTQRFFGKPVSGNSIKADGTQRAAEEMDVTVSGNTTHVRQGDILPTNAAITDSTGHVLIPAYVVDKTILGKWIHKDAIKYYVGYSTQTEFFNSKNLSTNRYATWYFNKPARLSSYPIITFRLKEV